jgi:hypothetical protein
MTDVQIALILVAAMAIALGYLELCDRLRR